MYRILVVTAEPEAAQIIRAAYPDGEVCIVDSLEPRRNRRRWMSRWSLPLSMSPRSDRSQTGKSTPRSSARSEKSCLVRAWWSCHHNRKSERRSAYVREGANDYLTYPIVREEVQLVRESIERRERLRSELRYRRDQSLETETFGAITSRADSMKAVLRKIRQVAPTRSTVLLTGETGTGKSFLAKIIHQNSTRAQRQFVSIHCGAIPDTLLESELFGHERGAFTGADRRRLGKFEIASGGTLFLDEIATITPAMQVKLLNVLQERTIQRVGGERDVEVDVRILAATNVDLEEMTADWEFQTGPLLPAQCFSRSRSRR